MSRETSQKPKFVKHMILWRDVYYTYLSIIANLTHFKIFV